MRQLADIENELDSIGANIKYIGRRSVKELPRILVENEKIKYCFSGRYSGGYAIICVTNLRILLVDKKPFFLTLEDIRYDMIMEVDFGHQMMSATAKFIMPNKSLSFTAYKKQDLRMMTRYVQKRVLEHRQQHVLEQQLVNTPIAAEPQLQNSGQLSSIPSPLYVASISEELPISVPRAINPYVKSALTIRRRSNHF